MSRRIRFLPCHEHKVLVIAVENQNWLTRRVTVADYRPFLSQNPIISTYAPVTDLRGFAGYIGIEDLADISIDFRAARVELGHDPFLTVPQVIIFDPKSYTDSNNLLDLVRAASKYPDRVMAAFDSEQAWEFVAPGTKIPDEVKKFLRGPGFLAKLLG